MFIKQINITGITSYYLDYNDYNNFDTLYIIGAITTNVYIYVPSIMKDWNIICKVTGNTSQTYNVIYIGCANELKTNVTASYAIIYPYYTVLATTPTTGTYRVDHILCDGTSCFDLNKRYMVIATVSALITSNATIAFSNIFYDHLSSYSAGYFTLPFAGHYLVSGSAVVDVAGGTLIAKTTVSGTASALASFPAANHYEGFSMPFVVTSTTDKIYFFPDSTRTVTARIGITYMGDI